MTRNNIISVQNLTKRFGNFTAVDNISFDVKQGEIFRRLGYSLENRELIEGGMCLGVPIRDYTKNVVAAISLSTSYPSMDKAKLLSFKAPLFAAGLKISTELGYMEEC